MTCGWLTAPSVGSVRRVTSLGKAHVMRLRRVLALAAALVLLVGCSAEKQSAAKLASPSAASSSPTTAPTREPEKEGPKDFIRRWAYVEREMQVSGDTAEYLRLSRDCRACADIAALVERRYAAGGLVAWGGWRIQGIEPRGPGGTDFLVRVHSARFRYKESPEDRITSFRGGLRAYRISLEPARGSWVVTGRTEVPRRPRSGSGSTPV